MAALALLSSVPATPALAWGDEGHDPGAGAAPRPPQPRPPSEPPRNSGRPEALALIDAMLATRPHAYPVPLSELRHHA